MAAVGGGEEGGKKDGGNNAGAWSGLQYNVSVGVIIWGQIFGSDGGHAKSNLGILSSGSHTYFWDHGEAHDEWIVGVVLSG